MAGGHADLAHRIALQLEAGNSFLASLGPPGVTVEAIMMILEAQDLWATDVMAVLEALRAQGRLHELLSLLTDARLRSYLRAKGVPWEYVVHHWQYSVGDVASFIAGMAAGAASIDVTWIALILTGKPLGPEIARRASELWQLITELLSPRSLELLAAIAGSPADYARRGLDQLVDGILENLWRREFFAAGQTVGTLATSVAALVITARKAMEKLAPAALALKQMTVAEVELLGIELRELVRAVEQRIEVRGRWVLQPVGANVSISTPDGNPVGWVKMSRASGGAGVGGAGSLGGGRGVGGGGGGPSPGPERVPLSELEDLAVSPRSLPVRARAPEHLAPPRVPRRGLRRLADLPSSVLDKLPPDLRRRLEAVPWHRRDEGPEILDAMLRFTGSAGFDEVLEAWARLGTDTLADNARRGAAHVIRFASANIDPRVARFEAGVPSFTRPAPIRPKVAVRRDWMDFRRVADIVEPGHRYELKSVKEFHPAYVKQLTRDLATRLSSDPDFAESLTWVFDRSQLRGTTKAQLVRQILDAIERDALLAGYGDRLPAFRGAINRMVRIWPE